MENGKRGFIEFGKGRNSLSPCHSSSVLGDLQMGHLIPKRQVLLTRLTNEKNETDSAFFTDLGLVDEPCPPTIHHVRAEVVEARTVAVVLKDRGEI